MQRQTAQELAVSTDIIEADRVALVAASRIPRGTEDRLVREEALSRWRSALSDEAAASALAASTVETQQVRALAALRDAKAAKRSLSRYVSPEQRRLDWEELRSDLLWERVLVWPNLVAIVTEQVRAILYAPLVLFNPVYLSAFLRQGFWLFLFLAGWWFIRARSSRIASWFIARLAARHTRRSGLHAVLPEATQLVRASLDLAIGWLLRDSLVSFLPLLGFAVWVYLQVALYRLFVALFDVIV